jgi:4-hydroxythreonine-4-phosphate dehydrogenase
VSGTLSIAVVSGEPAGVGPELCLRLAGQRFKGARVFVLGDCRLLEERAARISETPAFREVKGAVENSKECAPETTDISDTLDILHIPLCVPVAPGRLDPANSPYVLKLIDRALAGCMSGEFAAMVTAPAHKGVINDAGIHFTGHTEYLAEKTGTPRVVMMLAGGGLKVALATTHLALKDVAAALTQNTLEECLRILHAEMKAKYGIASPRILVSGLNPHAGEGGRFGREEIDVQQPVLERLRGEGMRLFGPFPADTLFTPPVLSRGDCVLAMYHDQGLAVLKYASFGRGINVTLGLPVIRTSVDHGTALDLAGKGTADPGSLFEAVEQAVEMARRAIVPSKR